MVTKRQVEAAADAFVELAEKPEHTKALAVRNAIKGEPAWKTRNREPKTTGTQFRFSDSQLKLLQMAKADQEKSIQKVLESIVWPVLEQLYGATEEDSPS